MSKTSRMVIVGVLLCAVAAVLVLKRGEPQARHDADLAEESIVASNQTAGAGLHGAKGETLPRLVDLGADKCVPCKMMTPILEELKEEYAGTFDVAFIDVWKHPEAAEQHGIRMIPTQIFYDATGKELWRHEGFLAKQAILDQWQALGVALDVDTEE